MAEIAPNSVFKLLRGCPLDSDYTNSLWFSSSSAQYSYFNGLTKYTLSNQQYQRHSKGVIRVSIPADDLFDINYCMFQNTSFGNKWFYAFVTDVEYVNNQCTNVFYEIDVLQTYYFDYEMGVTYIDRETPATDQIGDNLVPESIEIGESICQQEWDKNYGHTLLSSSFSVVLYTCQNMNIIYQNPSELNPNPYIPALYGDIDQRSGMYTPCTITILPANNNLAVNQAIQNALLNQQSIVQMYIVPTELANNTSAPQLPDAGISAFTAVRPAVFNFGGKTYVPKNNKMYTYPYMSLVLSNHQGSTATYRWENFTSDSLLQPSGQAIFGLQGSCNPNPAYICKPLYYEGNSYDHGISFGNFPTVAWSEDTFTNWYLRNGNSFIVGSLTSILNQGAHAVVNGAVGNVAGATMDLMGIYERSIMSLAQITDIKQTPDQVYGLANIDTAQMASGQLGVSAYAMCIKPEMAEVVDGYFTRFGYATHKLKKPSLRNRQNWTYVKTIGCMIHAKSGTGLNAEAEKKICQIFDNGITFWTNGSIVGEYGLTNGFITT